MRCMSVTLILLLATATEVRGYLKLLQDALRIGERAREGEASLGGIRKDWARRSAESRRTSRRTWTSNSDGWD